MKKVNFMPETFSRAQQRRRRVVRLTAVLLVVAAAGWVLLKRESIRRLEDMEHQLVSLHTQVEQLQTLQTQRGEVSKQAALQRRLEAPVPAVSVIAALAELTPPSVGLLSLSLAGEPITPVDDEQSGNNRKKRRKTRDDDDAETQLPLTLVLEGVAPDDMTVARFIEQLGRRPMFGKVELGYCRPTEGGEYESRDFQITSRIPLDRAVVFTADAEVTRAD